MQATAAENLARAAVAAWNSRGPAAFVALAREDVVLEDPPEMPDRGQWTGRSAVARRLEEVSAATGGGWAEIEKVRSLGDSILVLLDWRRGDSPRAPTLASIHLLLEVDGSQISAVRIFLDEHAAIKRAMESETEARTPNPVAWPRP
jgi:hypothetical protein